MKTLTEPGVAQRLLKLSIRFFLFFLGLFLALLGAYLILSGVAILKNPAVAILPALLNILVGFGLVSSGWRMVRSCNLGKQVS